MERFLRYSREHDRAIRLIFMDEAGKMRQVSCVVEELKEQAVSLYILRPPQRLTIDKTQILAADYVKGDEGQD